jgi:hypothetical protein
VLSWDKQQQEKDKGVTMALDAYSSKDIGNALLAARHASSTALHMTDGENEPFARGYEAGYQAALITIALAFGLIQPGDRSESCEWPTDTLLHPQGR